ncbi:hypothetical protein CHS0354_005269 [Potamilus streckersoni]|uniref:UPAR/Ly6 domain-containing protein qvr n=1 Tax=Potamilus streckersoni TaxID=2493646 RepID=A0AAE0S332_9BIVA|nr:hypothetical protein CHS0354_005269 [Potamilus streckersoni]
MDLYFDKRSILLFMISMVSGGDEDCIGTKTIKCYECASATHDNYCGRKLNDSHPDVKRISCEGYCVKWVREPVPGKIWYQRTCSAKLPIGMRINVVCMKESRPSSGMLCFCDKNDCNGAIAVTSYISQTSFAMQGLIILLSWNILFNI